MPCITMEWPTGLVTFITGFVFAAKTEKEGRVPVTKVRAQGNQIGRSHVQLGEGSEEAAGEAVTGGTWYGKEARGEANLLYPHIVCVGLCACCCLLLVQVAPM